MGLGPAVLGGHVGLRVRGDNLGGGGGDIPSSDTVLCRSDQFRTVWCVLEPF